MRRLGHERGLTDWRVLDNIGPAMSIARSHEGRSQIIAEQCDIRRVRPVGHVEVPPELLPLKVGCCTFVGSISAKSIVSWPVMPATVPAKVAELSSLSVPVSAANAKCPRGAVQTRLPRVSALPSSDYAVASA
jgi:hypothetical protein